MAFPTAPIDLQIYTTTDGRQYKYNLASDTWDYISVQNSAPKNNNAANVPPTVADSTVGGYAIGSLWVDVVANKSYINVDDTAAAAIWTELTANITVAAAAPTVPTMGQMYLNTSDGFAYVWNGTAWVDITAAGASVKDNFAAVTAPAITDDSAAGYTIGSSWVNTTGLGSAYICVSAALGAAAWKVMA